MMMMSIEMLVDKTDASVMVDILQNFFDEG